MRDGRCKPAGPPASRSPGSWTRRSMTGAWPSWTRHRFANCPARSGSWRRSRNRAEDLDALVTCWLAGNHPQLLDTEAMTPRTRSMAGLTIVVTAAAVALSASPASAASPDVVVSQVYGGGGNSGATYTNDFVELYNRGTEPVDRPDLLHPGRKRGHRDEPPVARPRDQVRDGRLAAARRPPEDQRHRSTAGDQLAQGG